MSLRPVIFVSAVTRELKFARKLVADTLTSLGYEPDWQDIFGTEAGDLTAMLRRKVDAASAVVQLVGNGYGAEPAAPLPDFGRVSYTQYEALYAKSRGKKVYYLFLGPDFPAEPTAAAEPEELRALQTAYRESIRASGTLRHPAATYTELENKILRLRNDLSRLRRRTRQWATAISIAALLTIAGIAWLIHTVTHLETKQSESAARETELHQVLDKFIGTFGRDGFASPPGDPALAAKAYASLEAKLKLPAGTLAKELPAFAARLLLRNDTSTLDRARALFVQKKYVEAEAAALTAKDEALRGDTPSLDHAITALETAGLAAGEQFHYQQALNHFSAAAALTDQARAPLQWAGIQHRIACAQFVAGDTRGAATTFRAVVQVDTRELGAEHPDTLRNRFNLAIALDSVGYVTEAVAEYRAVLAIMERDLGKEHPDTLSARSVLATTLGELGNNAEAEAEHRAILAIRERVPGPEHPDTLGNRNNMANAMAAQGRNEEAAAEHKAVLAIRERVEGPEHRHTLSNRSDLANALAALDKHEAAEAEFRAVLAIEERTLGAEHPDTLSTRSNVAVTLSRQGKTEQSLAMNQEVLATRLRVLGADHQDTIESRHNVAWDLKQLSRFSEALAEAERTLDASSRVLGKDHPDTRGTLALITLLKAQLQPPPGER
jgi:tetratricopeptide (TPR) repeat protein